MRTMLSACAIASSRASGRAAIRGMVLRKRVGATGTVLAFGLMLSSCSLAGPSDHTFTKVELPANQNAEPDKIAKPVDKAAMAEAARVCKEQTREKGIKSVLAIFSSMRPGAVDEDYITCMKGKGYTVAK